jgi:hypothetical protein
MQSATLSIRPSPAYSRTRTMASTSLATTSHRAPLGTPPTATRHVPIPTEAKKASFAWSELVEFVVGKATSIHSAVKETPFIQFVLKHTDLIRSIYNKTVMLTSALNLSEAIKAYSTATQEM